MNFVALLNGAILPIRMGSVKLATFQIAGDSNDEPSQHRGTKVQLEGEVTAIDPHRCSVNHMLGDQFKIDADYEFKKTRGNNESCFLRGLVDE